MSQEKTIRFIDTNYRTLFTIPDGGNLRMIFPDGKSKVSRCRYVDEYHTEVAGRVYRICEFAGHMERGGIACAPEEPCPGRRTSRRSRSAGFSGLPSAHMPSTSSHARRRPIICALNRLSICGQRGWRWTVPTTISSTPAPCRHVPICRGKRCSNRCTSGSTSTLHAISPGHSLSVSDVVGLKGKSGVSFHYVDSFGFAELPAFLPAPDRAMEEASRAAELAEQPFELVSFRGKPALLADWRVDRSLLPQEIYAYDLRYGEEWGVPVTLENQASVNFCGTLLFNEPLTLSPDGASRWTGMQSIIIDGKAISLRNFKSSRHFSAGRRC